MGRFCALQGLRYFLSDRLLDEIFFKGLLLLPPAQQFLACRGVLIQINNWQTWPLLLNNPSPGSLL